MSEREEKIFAQVAELAEEYHVKKIVLFGSRARRTHQEKSDIDIAVYGCEDFINFYFDVEEKVWTLLKFDIINMDEKISDELQQEIDREGVAVYEKI